MRRPINGVPPISQTYGVRSSIYRKGYHTGVDYAVGNGTNIVSPTNGTIIQVGDGRKRSDGRGFFMIIRGDDGVTHHLYHLMYWLKGSGRVSEGQHVAESNNTGLSTGPHLHWETRRRGKDFNPAEWLFKPVPPPPAPKPKGGNVFRNDNEIQAFYYMLRGRKATAAEVIGWRGKPYIQFVTNKYALAEIKNREKSRQVLEGKVSNLSGQIGNIQKQLDELKKRPTTDEVNKLKDAVARANEQAEKDRLEAERLQIELERTQKHPPVDEIDYEEVLGGCVRENLKMAKKPTRKPEETLVLQIALFVLIVFAILFAITI